jgi:phosphatidylinositol glycan class B
LAFLIVIVKKPRSIFVWTILPFFVVHSIIAHKELRFLFPVINLVPIILVLAFQALKWDIRKWKVPGRIAIRTVTWIWVAINVIGAVTVSLKPSGGNMTITHYIRRNYGDQPIRLISYNHSNPYGPWGLICTCYMEKDMEDTRLESLNGLSDLLLNENKVNLLVLKRIDAETKPAQEFIAEQNGRKVVQGLPKWMEPLLTIYGGYHLERIFELYEIQQ